MREKKITYEEGEKGKIGIVFRFEDSNKFRIKKSCSGLKNNKTNKPKSHKGKERKK